MPPRLLPDPAVLPRACGAPRPPVVAVLLLVRLVRLDAVERLPLPSALPSALLARPADPLAPAGFAVFAPALPRPLDALSSDAMAPARAGAALRDELADRLALPLLVPLDAPLDAAGMGQASPTFIAPVNKSRALLAPCARVLLALSAKSLAVLLAVRKASCAKLWLASKGLRWDTSCMAELAMVWNCCVSAPHHCMGSMTAAMPAPILAASAAGSRGSCAF